MSDDGHIICGKRWQVVDAAVAEERVCIIEVVDDGLVPDRGASDGLALDEGNSVTGQEVVSGLHWLGWHAWVGEAHIFAELQIVVLPSAASTRLLTTSGSTEFPCNKASVTSETSSGLG